MANVFRTSITYNIATGDAGKTEFDLDFYGKAPGYIDQKHVWWELNGVLQDVAGGIGLNGFTFETATSVKLKAYAAKAGDVITFYRVLPKEKLYRDFTDGGGIGESLLAKQSRSILHITHEVRDGYGDAAFENPQTDMIKTEYVATTTGQAQFGPHPRQTINNREMVFKNGLLLRKGDIYTTSTYYVDFPGQADPYDPDAGDAPGSDTGGGEAAPEIVENKIYSIIQNGGSNTGRGTFIDNNGSLCYADKSNYSQVRFQSGPLSFDNLYMELTFSNDGNAGFMITDPANIEEIPDIGARGDFTYQGGSWYTTGGVGAGSFENQASEDRHTVMIKLKLSTGQIWMGHLENSTNQYAEWEDTPVQITPTANMRLIIFTDNSNASTDTIRWHHPAGCMWYPGDDWKPCGPPNTYQLDVEQTFDYTKITEGNTKVSGQSVDNLVVPGLSRQYGAAKYYWEIKLTGSWTTSAQMELGVCEWQINRLNTHYYYGLADGSWYGNAIWLDPKDQKLWSYPGYSSVATGSWASGDIARFCFDVNTGEMWLAKNNGAWIGGGDPELGTTPSITNVRFTAPYGMKGAQIYMGVAGSSAAAQLVFGNYEVGASSGIIVIPEEPNYTINKGDKINIHTW